MIARQNVRSAVKWYVQIRAESGLRSFGTMIDLSATGCRIQFESNPPRLGSKVIVRPDGIQGLDAAVQWRSGNQVGLVFDRPIYLPVLEHFVRKHATFSSLISL